MDTTVPVFLIDGPRGGDQLAIPRTMKYLDVAILHDTRSFGKEPGFEKVRYAIIRRTNIEGREFFIGVSNGDQ